MAATILSVRNRFDHLGKQIGEEALGPSGRTIVQAEISPETQHADIRHEPDLARVAERARLGLLGRVATIRCLIEIYAHAPGGVEFRACLEKYLAFWRELARQARRAEAKAKKLGHPIEPSVEPFLWIIASGCPASVLRALKFKRARGWPKGVYFFGDDVLHVGVIVANELPRTRSTLLSSASWRRVRCCRRRSRIWQRCRRMPMSVR